jgi:hypothetical protein
MRYLIAIILATVVLPFLCIAGMPEIASLGDREKSDGFVSPSSAMPVMRATSYTWKSGGVNCVFTSVIYNCTGRVKVKVYHVTGAVWKESAWSSVGAGEASFGFNDMIVGDDYSQFQAIYDCTDGSCLDSEWTMVHQAQWTQPTKRQPPIEEEHDE